MDNIMERILLDKPVGDCTADDLVKVILFCNKLIHELGKDDPRVESIRRVMIERMMAD